MKTRKRKAIIFAVCIVAVAFIASFLLVQINIRGIPGNNKRKNEGID